MGAFKKSHLGATAPCRLVTERLSQAEAGPASEAARSPREHGGPPTGRRIRPVSTFRPPGSHKPPSRTPGGGAGQGRRWTGLGKRSRIREERSDAGRLGFEQKLVFASEYFHWQTNLGGGWRMGPFPPRCRELPPAGARLSKPGLAPQEGARGSGTFCPTERSAGRWWLGEALQPSGNRARARHWACVRPPPSPGTLHGP